MSQPNNLSIVPGADGGKSATPSLTLPTEKTLLQATKLSLKTKKPICFYFYIDSLKGKITIVSDGEDRVIFKMKTNTRLQLLTLTNQKIVIL